MDTTGSESSLGALLDEIEQLSDRNDDQRSQASGSNVHLNVYNMIGLNAYISHIGLGAFHTGVEVYGVEYAFGGHPYSYTGVYNMEPKQEENVSTQGGVQFKESLSIGYTSLSEKQVEELVNSLGKEYNGNVYNVFHKNCNHFSGELCYKLSGKHIPHWVNRLAYISSWMPFVIGCLPPAWVTPTPVAPTGDDDDHHHHHHHHHHRNENRGGASATAASAITNLLSTIPCSFSHSRNPRAHTSDSHNSKSDSADKKL